MKDRAFLLRRRTITKADLAMKLEAEDWHGVADAAMDLREIDAMLSMAPPPTGPGAPPEAGTGEP